MGRDPSWMRPMDSRILEFLGRTEQVKYGGMWMKPTGVAINIGADRSYVNTRLRKLAEEGYVERSEDGFYKINDKGRDYLQP